MSQGEAYKLLANAMQPYRELPYEQLREFVGDVESRQVAGEDAREYIVEIAVDWNDDTASDIIVAGFVAHAGTGPLQRLNRSFVRKLDPRTTPSK